MFTNACNKVCLSLAQPSRRASEHRLSCAITRHRSMVRYIPCPNLVFIGFLKILAYRERGNNALHFGTIAVIVRQLEATLQCFTKPQSLRSIISRKYLPDRFRINTRGFLNIPTTSV